MRTRRQKIQLELALGPAAKGEAQSAGDQGTEACMARAAPECPATGPGPSIEAVIQPGNLEKVLARVRRNRGVPSLNGLTVDSLAARLKDHWPEIRSRLLAGASTHATDAAGGDTEVIGGDSPARRADGARPLHSAGGDAGIAGRLGTRLVGPGLRPERSAHQAVAYPQEHIRAGFGIVADLDLEEVLRSVRPRDPDGSGGQTRSWPTYGSG